MTAPAPSAGSPLHTEGSRTPMHPDRWPRKVGGWVPSWVRRATGVWDIAAPSHTSSVRNITRIGCWRQSFAAFSDCIPGRDSSPAPRRQWVGQGLNRRPGGIRGAPTGPRVPPGPSSWRATTWRLGRSPRPPRVPSVPRASWTATAPSAPSVPPRALSSFSAPWLASFPPRYQ